MKYFDILRDVDIFSFSPPGKLPSRKALKVAKHLLKCGVETGTLDPHYELLAATQVSSTKSPGLTLYNEIQEWDHWSPHAEED